MCSLIQPAISQSQSDWILSTSLTCGCLEQTILLLKTPRTETEKDEATVSLVTWTRSLAAVIEASWVIKPLFVWMAIFQLP